VRSVISSTSNDSHNATAASLCFGRLTLTISLVGIRRNYSFSATVFHGKSPGVELSARRRFALWLGRDADCLIPDSFRIKPARLPDNKGEQLQGASVVDPAIIGQKARGVRQAVRPNGSRRLVHDFERNRIGDGKTSGIRCPKPQSSLGNAIRSKSMADAVTPQNPRQFRADVAVIGRKIRVQPRRHSATAMFSYLSPEQRVPSDQPLQEVLAPCEIYKTRSLPIAKPVEKTVTAVQPSRSPSTWRRRSRLLPRSSISRR
jgi:hypothetical protein